MALKIGVSGKINSSEIQILEATSAFPMRHAGQAHLVQMLGNFTMKGPNGTHGCLVLELLGSSVSDAVEYFYKDERLPATLAKSAAYQAFAGH